MAAARTVALYPVAFPELADQRPDGDHFERCAAFEVLIAGKQKSAAGLKRRSVVQGVDHAHIGARPNLRGQV